MCEKDFVYGIVDNKTGQLHGSLWREYTDASSYRSDQMHSTGDYCSKRWDIVLIDSECITSNCIVR